MAIVMSYSSAIDHLYALGQELAPAQADKPRRKFDLAYMRTLAKALGDPQTTFPSILIAGTNGKGSTAATLASILAAAGYRTGLYTSPHLIHVNERIQMSTQRGTQESPVSGQLPLCVIPDLDFARLYFKVDDSADILTTDGTLPHHPSFFEMLTAVAFLYFAEQKAEIAILEVGLGGRLDATNIVDPILSVITDISLDHQEYLGHTIAEITREKAGILRPQGTLITLPQHPEANRTIGEIAATMPTLRAVNAAAYIPSNHGRSAEIRSTLPRSDAPTSPFTSENNPARNQYSVALNGTSLHVDSPLPGQHQQRNLALAITAVDELCNRHGYNITNTAVELGIRATHWPGRLQLVRKTDDPDVLLDVAHNPAGAWTLRAAIAQEPAWRPRTLLFSCLQDKDLREMTHILFPLFDQTQPERRSDHIIFAPIDSPRATSLNDLIAAAEKLDIPSLHATTVAEAFSLALNLTPIHGLIVITGSVYLVGSVRQLLTETA